MLAERFEKTYNFWFWIQYHDHIACKKFRSGPRHYNKLYKPVEGLAWIGI